MKARTIFSTAIGTLALLAGALLAAQPASAAGIEIPDPGLKGCINRALEQNDDADISPQQALSLQSVSCDVSISSFSGIEQFSNLQIYVNYASSPQLTDLSPVAGLLNLQRFVILGSSVRDLSPLKDLVNLNRLQIQNSKISDVSALAGLSKLTVAVLELNQISDFSPLKNIVDRKGRVRAGGQFVDLPAINVGATQANPVKGPNGELPRTYLSPDARGSVAADGSSWSFSKATTANQITWDFENLPYSREVFDVVGAFTQASLPVSSTVKDDSASTGYQTPVTIDVLANDGLPEESPLDPRSLGFLDSNGQPASTLNLPAGTFDIIDGKIRFTPATGFSGTVPAVEYQARNFDGILSTAKITVTVGPAPAGITPVTPPVAVPDPVQPAGHLTAVDNQTKPTAQAELANTGATTGAPLALAGLLLLAGIAAVFCSRRRAA